MIVGFSLCVSVACTFLVCMMLAKIMEDTKQIEEYQNTIDERVADLEVAIENYKYLRNS